MAWDVQTGSGGGGSWIAGDNWGHIEIDQIRQNFTELDGLQFHGTTGPEGVVTAGPGAVYRRTSGSLQATLYVKESGAGNTGWRVLLPAYPLVDDGNSGAALAINWALGDVHFVTLTGNVTFTFSNPSSGRTLTLITAQDAIAGRTITWPASVLWPAATAPTPTPTTLKMDLYQFTYLPTPVKYLGRGTLNY